MVSNSFGGLSDLGGLGGLLGGLAKSVVPRDTPEGKLLAAQSELSDLQRQESELLLEIGRQAYEQKPSAWPQDTKLQLIHQNIISAEAVLNEAKRAKEVAEADKAAEDMIGRCSACGCKNADGVKFCQECGSKLGACYCVSCGAELKPGIRFCGECGARQDD